MADAWDQVESWLDADASWIPTPTGRHREVLRTGLMTTGVRANHVPDAHLAALTMEHGLALASNDSGFARFDGLKWFDPPRP